MYYANLPSSWYYQFTVIFNFDNGATLHYCVWQWREFILHLCLLVDLEWNWCRCGGTVDICMTSVMCKLSPLLLCTWTLLDKSGLTEFCYFVWRFCVAYLYSYCVGLCSYLFLFEGWNVCVISFALSVRSWRSSFLPKYRDCTSFNDYELYFMCCGVMLLLHIKYIYIYIYICIYIYIYICIFIAYVELLRLKLVV